MSNNEHQYAIVALQAAMKELWDASYAELLQRAGSHSETAVLSAAGNRYLIMIDIARPNQLECAVEISGCLAMIQDGVTVKSRIGASFYVTPDDLKVGDYLVANAQ
ncbi:hypothetical protein O5O45_26070 [Hahella aquimaris]|uniref:hypothetical protein n=1 Tax=Hahella sp. HNIBRBA332 TaxID=3015983 RepID=UPI00273A9680|nr:hypothetical protein [Hahella sp. HNIBRBA332]WLQ13201.1 hypothetical protein O5O45_26070 [Hahella sp. HNIBRBA332]